MESQLTDGWTDGQTGAWTKTPHVCPPNRIACVYSTSDPRGRLQSLHTRGETLMQRIPSNSTRQMRSAEGAGRKEGGREGRMAIKADGWVVAIFSASVQKWKHWAATSMCRAAACAVAPRWLKKTQLYVALPVLKSSKSQQVVGKPFDLWATVGSDIWQRSRHRTKKYIVNYTTSEKFGRTLWRDFCVFSLIWLKV